MTAELLHRAAIRCPPCGAVNSITANTLALDSGVVCFSCHVEIGQWRDLKNGSVLAKTDEERRETIHAPSLSTIPQPSVSGLKLRS